MTGVLVVLPWGGDCPHRKAARAHVEALYASEHPGWRVAVGVHDGPWVKARAVDAAIRAHPSADVVVVADADMWTPGLADAVDRVVSGRNAWAQPYRWIRRLTPEATGDVYEGRVAVERAARIEKRPVPVFLGGGIVVTTPDVWRDCPMDPRFVGWGREDESWGRALGTLHGPRWTPTGDVHVYHLWHPPADRPGHGKGRPESERLAVAYRERMRDRVGMRRLVDQARRHLTAP